MRKETGLHVLFTARKKFNIHPVKSHWHLHNRSVMLYLSFIFNDSIDLLLLIEISSRCDIAFAFAFIQCKYTLIMHRSIYF